MVDFSFGIIIMLLDRNQKYFKPIANGNSRMITLIDEPLPS